MNWYVLLNLFFSGIILGSSVCSIGCGWIFLPFIFEKDENKRKTFFKFVMFHSGKILSYTIIGGLVGYSTSFVSSFNNNKVALYTGALFFLLLGFLNMIMPEKFRIKMKKNLVCFSGFLVSFIPCGAFAGVLVYIGYVCNDLISGALAGFFFGLGNAINPLVLTIFFVPNFSKRFEKMVKGEIVFKLATTTVFCFWAGTLFWRAFQ